MTSPRHRRARLAPGTGFADALTAGPAAAFTDGVLLLVDGANPAGSPEVYDFLRTHRADVGAVRLVGGTTAVSDAVAEEVADALGAEQAPARHR